MCFYSEERGGLTGGVAGSGGHPSRTPLRGPRLGKGPEAGSRGGAASLCTHVRPASRRNRVAAPGKRNALPLCLSRFAALPLSGLSLASNCSFKKIKI